MRVLVWRLALVGAFGVGAFRHNTTPDFHTYRLLQSQSEFPRNSRVAGETALSPIQVLWRPRDSQARQAHIVSTKEDTGTEPRNRCRVWMRRPSIRRSMPGTQAGTWRNVVASPDTPGCTAGRKSN